MRRKNLNIFGNLEIPGTSGALIFGGVAVILLGPGFGVQYSLLIGLLMIGAALWVNENWRRHFARIARRRR